MPLGCPPFCNRRVSPSSEQLHSQMWLHRFDVISLSNMQRLWRFGCMLCNRSFGAATVHEQNGCPALNTKERFNSYTSSGQSQPAPNFTRIEQVIDLSSTNSQTLSRRDTLIKTLILSLFLGLPLIISSPRLTKRDKYMGCYENSLTEADTKS